MCLAIPGKVTEIYSQNGIKMGKIDYSGTINTASLEYLPEIQVGQYTLVHAGFALSILNDDEVKKSLDALRELGDIIDDMDKKS